MTSRLNAVKSSSRVLVEHILAARGAMRANDERRGAIDAFLKQFELSDSEKALLSASEAVGTAAGAGGGAASLDVEGVLQVMERLSALSRRALELQRAGQQAIGTELRSEMARWEEKGHQALFRWIVSRPHELSSAHQPAPAHEPTRAHQAPSAAFARALRVLRTCRPLHAACVREVAAARSALLGDSFERALTIGGGSAHLHGGPADGLAGEAGGARPIELLAAEPTAYVGAMLAWVHGAAAAELAALRQLCAGGAGADGDGSDGVSDSAGGDGGGHESGSAEALPEALALALERVSRAVELRVGAVIDSLSAAHGSGGMAALPLALVAPPPAGSGISPRAGGGRASVGRALAELAPLCSLGLSLRAFSKRFGGLLLPPAARPLADGGPAACATSEPGAAAVPARATLPLAVAMAQCAARADASTDAALSAQLQRASDALRLPPPVDLSCPPLLLDAVGGALGILRAVQLAQAEQRERSLRAAALMERVLSALERAVEDALSPDAGRLSRTASSAAASAASASLPLLSGAERTVFRLNCASALAAALAAATSTPTAAAAAAPATPSESEPEPDACASACAPHVARLRESAARLADALVDEETGALFQRCGLSAKLAALQTAREQPGLQLSQIPSLEPAAMAALMRTFYALLYGASAGSAGASLMPNCDRVADSTLRLLAARRVSRNVSLAHRSLYEAISDARNGYVNAEPRIVLHTPAQVDTLLDCAE